MTRMRHEQILKIWALLWTGGPIYHILQALISHFLRSWYFSHAAKIFNGDSKCAVHSVCLQTWQTIQLRDPHAYDAFLAIMLGLKVIIWLFLAAVTLKMIPDHRILVWMTKMCGTSPDPSSAVPPGRTRHFLQGRKEKCVTHKVVLGHWNFPLMLKTASKTICIFQNIFHFYSFYAVSTPLKRSNVLWNFQ